MSWYLWTDIFEQPILGILFWIPIIFFDIWISCEKIYSGQGVFNEICNIRSWSGVNLRQDARIQDLYFNISEMMLSITSLYIISDVPKNDNIWAENSDVIDSFISEILKYKSWILASWRKRSWTVRFTPFILAPLSHFSSCLPLLSLCIAGVN